ncbi:MAG: hypothetical protein Q8S84_08740 [bacterium]|nr:hypothetical protein [bacterium]
MYKYVFSGINHTFFFDSNVNHFSPNTNISHFSGSINHIILFIVVVLPAPFGHKKPYISPALTEKLIQNNTFFFASVFSIFFTSNIFIIFF